VKKKKIRIFGVSWG